MNRCREIKSELTSLQKDVAALNRVLRMLVSDYAPEAGRTNRRAGPPEGPFAHGEMTAAALAALREAGKPATAAECAAAMLAAKGLPPDDALLAQLTNKVGAVFAQKAASKQLRRVANGDGRQVHWEVAR